MSQTRTRSNNRSSSFLNCSNITIFFFDGSGNNEGGYGAQEKTVMQAKSDQILLLDTRDNDEFEVCHVRHSLNILTSKKIDLILIMISD